jgi:hypothetical protein
MEAVHIEESVSSVIEIQASEADIWNHITEVRLEQFSDPLLFKLLNIPKPLKAEMIAAGEGGSRIAYFDSGRRFLQKITVWKPLREYSFSFNPEKGFKVGYFFDLSDGVFRILSGSYHLTPLSDSISLTLHTRYSLDKRMHWIGKLPVRLVLTLFQKYLLSSIKQNTELNEGH